MAFKLEASKKKGIAIISMGLLALNTLSKQLNTSTWVPETFHDAVIGDTLVMKIAAFGVIITIWWLLNKEII
jgi:hypothetical protein